ncbi:hypothetical protein N7468_000681 [Penicillium chermesinum]|uniref:Uncharacterized protein n=1 Tax=Penicillium chermesinum TaxID=63820 RepID=A0A9W9TZK9_9EURO|nr:uncharacterized protein N7468_000681 [Penicillium chermesinum]KAJ5249230.1 hypothetical protein N7468_000681 [Penicillium chermesinum]
MHLMHHRDIVPDSAVAPSPIVPTYRSNSAPKSSKSSKSSKRRKSSMASSVSGSPESTVSRGSVPRHQARSAGMAERPSRNESLSDLVRFFQTQNVPPAGSVTSPDSTTALPTVESPEAKEVSKDQLKPLHRRLLQFTQRQKKDPSSKTKTDDHQRQIEALQREGYLLLLQNKKAQHIDRRKALINPRAASIVPSPDQRSKMRLSSLDLNDIGSMVDVAVSISEYNDPSPPPYQQSGSNMAEPRDLTTASQTTSALASDRSSSEVQSQRTTESSISPSTSTSVVETQESRPQENSRPWPSTSIDPSIRIDEEITSDSPRPALGRKPRGIPENSDVDHDTQEQTSGSSQLLQGPEHPPIPPQQTPANPSPPSLKLFPDVAPLRVSGQKARRMSATPRYQTPPKPASTASSDAWSDGETPRPPAQRQSQRNSSSTSSRVKNDEPVCSGAVNTPTTSAKTAPGERTSKPAPAQKQSRVRPPSLAMGTLQAFPLPAPTRPLPSVPRSSNLTVPVDTKAHAIRPVRSESKALNHQASQPSPISEEPREELRPATVLGHINTADTANDFDDSEPPQSLRTTPERSKSTSPEENTPRRRAASLHGPRIHHLPERQQAPAKPHGKRAARKGLEINARLDRKNLPFGLPSPPPSAALPLDPPLQQNAGRSGHRNYTAPTLAGPSKTLDLAFNPANHRSSIISCSDSSRSSLRHERIPETDELSRAGSPLPSSDDECFGPSSGAKRSGRAADKTQPRYPVRRGYDTVDSRSSSHRSRLVPPIRSMTPQGRSPRSFEQSMSPVSQYSQSTHRSYESSNNHLGQGSTNDAAQLLADRISNLERQNQVLQAALMAALNAGVTPNLSHINLHESAVPASFHAAADPHPNRSNSRTESWMKPSRSSEQGGFNTPNSLRYEGGSTR